MTHDLLVRNAKLRRGEILDIAISDGKIIEMAADLRGGAAEEIDAQGNLVTETFVIGQQHLDKVYTGDWVDASAKTEYFEGDMGGAMTAIERAADVKDRYSEEDIFQRIDAALQCALFSGVSHMRAFIDIDSKAKLMGMRAALKARELWKGRVDLHVIAFPQDGILREPGTEEMLYQAMDLGADLVGGIPWIEFTDEDMRRHVDICFEIARKYDADVSMLVDDAGDPGLRTTEYLAIQADRHAWHGRVSACHARAMSQYNEVYHRKVLALLKRAGMGMVTNPHTAPLHIRVRDLAAAGVTIGLGGESLNDAYYPYGRCNMLEVAFVCSHTLWMMTPRDQEFLYDAITVNPARILRLDSYGLAPGNTADLVVLHDSSLRDALAHHHQPRQVIRNGRIVAETSFVQKARQG